MKEIGRKLLKEFVRDLAGSMEAYRDSTKLQMPELQDKSVPWQLRVRRSQALQRLGDIFEEESRGIAPPAIASFAALGFFSGGSEGPGGRRLLEDHDFGGRQGRSREHADLPSTPSPPSPRLSRQATLQEALMASVKQQR